MREGSSGATQDRRVEFLVRLRQIPLEVNPSVSQHSVQLRGFMSGAHRLLRAWPDSKLLGLHPRERQMYFSMNPSSG